MKQLIKTPKKEQVIVELYNKYRPMTFSDVVGQDLTKRILSQAIIKDRIANGYLFEGNRGLGKTTLAKIFAKALNCTNLGENGEPCCECESCKAIQNGRSMDVIELDAASNRGIETVRERIINKVNFKPMGKRKVYILDEVHQFSIDAWNAMLKILESPPPWCTFIFCTTNSEKIPATIMSRLQHYHLDDMSNDQIISRLKYISSQENIKYSMDGLRAIARLAQGGMRDAVSALDQLRALEEEITAQLVQELFGVLSDTVCDKLFDFLEQRQLDEAYAYVLELTSSQQVKDLSKLLDLLLKRLKDLIVSTLKKNSKVQIPRWKLIRWSSVMLRHEKTIQFTNAKELAWLCMLHELVGGQTGEITNEELRPLVESVVQEYLLEGKKVQIEEQKESRTISQEQVLAERPNKTKAALSRLLRSQRKG